VEGTLAISAGCFPRYLFRAYLLRQPPDASRTIRTRTSGTWMLPGLAFASEPCAAVAARVGSMAPAWAATFGDGTRPPTMATFRSTREPNTVTRFPTYLCTSPAPVRRYVVSPDVKSASVKWGASAASRVTHPVSVIDFVASFFVADEVVVVVV
jgi:hypothetical protein